MGGAGDAPVTALRRGPEMHIDSGSRVFLEPLRLQSCDPRSLSGASQRAALVVAQRLLDFLPGVHDERAVLHDRLA